MGIFTFKNLLRFPPKADLAFRWEFQAFLKFLLSHEGLKNSFGGKIFPRSLVFEALWERTVVAPTVNLSCSVHNKLKIMNNSANVLDKFKSV